MLELPVADAGDAAQSSTEIAAALTDDQAVPLDRGLAADCAVRQSLEKHLDLRSKGPSRPDHRKPKVQRNWVGGRKMGQIAVPVIGNGGCGGIRAEPSAAHPRVGRV